MSDLTELTIAAAREKLRAREIKATEIADAYIAAIERANPAINAYVVTTPEKARDMAKASDAKLAKGEGGALEGIPLGIKDLFATEGVHTQACSHVLDGFKPRYESTVTANLWADGAVMLGKLNMDEFAMGSSNETSHYGPVVNPWRAKGSNADLVPGGSSGGSAAAVSSFLCAGATATDTGGSIRQPAAFTGTVGIKPTYGRCSRWGIAAFASSLDQAGPIARDVRDAAILLRSMASVDPKDTTSVDRPVPDYEAVLGRSVKGMKVGIPKEYRVEGMPEEIEALWQKGIAWLKDAGAQIVDISLPHTKYALPAYYIVAPAEASSNLARYDGVRYGLRVPGKDIVEMYENTRAAGFGREVKRQIMIGTYVLSAGYYDAYYLRAQKVRTLIKRDFEQVFDAGVDVILTPATPSAAFGIADQDMAADPVKMYLNDIFTVTVNMAGLPGIAVPAGLDGNGLPLGLQLIGKPFEEETLFQAGHVIEQAAGNVPAGEVVVGREKDTDLPATRWEQVERLVSDMVRLRGPLRISVRQTTDGLGIHIPPSRQIGAIIFIMFWLCGWAVGEYFAIGEVVSSGFGFPGIFILVWLIPWTLAGMGCVWVILWQLFGTENLYFTAGALVREWRLLFQGRRRVVMGSEIMSVKVDGPGGDVAGLGTIKVETTGKSMRIGSGLDHHEAEFVANLIRGQAKAEQERSLT